MEINSKKFKTLQTTTITVLSGFLAETCCITWWCLNDGQLKVPTQREQEGNSAASTGEGALLLPPAVCWVPRDRPGAGCRAMDLSNSLNYFFTSSKASRSTSWLASFPPSCVQYVFQEFTPGDVPSTETPPGTGGMELNKPRDSPELQLILPSWQNAASSTEPSPAR